ncbi:MAG: tRNA lysidine(34) synthetase TilS [Cytophagales bacterium]|nr:tRNA lysidine(34) synthetase TilS [Rhizobacter sp.]
MAALPTPATAEFSPCIAVAYSAGRDSTALLHATARAAAEQGAQVVALHVHHGLSPHADEWLAHAQAQCARWAKQGLPVRLLSHRLTSKPLAGDSVEAWAREARYRALRDMAAEAGAQVVLLAQHRRDQAETFLLQALRGAGTTGLAGMPRVIERDGITWARPWLDHPREAIEAYVRQHLLRHVDDDSNADPRFARNRLRLSVWAVLTQAFPAAEASLADAAAWAGEASACLAELASLDLSLVCSASGLNLKAWQGLSQARRVNTLRAWLKLQSGRAAPSSLVQRLQHELAGTGSAQWPLSGGVLRRHRGWLMFTIDAPVVLTHGEARDTVVQILRAGRFTLRGWGGTLVAKRVKEGGVPLAWVAHLELRARQGGERFQAGIGRPARSLKKQFQAADIAEWERNGPLIYSGGQLVFVPGLGLDARVLAMPGQPQLSLHWHSG